VSREAVFRWAEAHAAFAAEWSHQGDDGRGGVCWPFRFREEGGASGFGTVPAACLAVGGRRSRPLEEGVYFGGDDAFELADCSSALIQSP